MAYLTMKSMIAGALAFAAAVSAQAPLYGQCGGEGWSGPTTCVAGSVCTFSNYWYSQCVPGTAVTTTRSSTLTTSTRPATTSSARTTSSRTSSAVLPPGTGFPSVSGTKFTIDGVTKYYPGTNCYWCSFLTNASDVDLVLGHLRTSGLKILRIWGFSDVNTVPQYDNWFQHLTASGSTINTGANGLGRLDTVVASAEKNGIKLIINFVNNWDDYGGIKAYTNAFGGTHNGWYTNTAAQTQYRKYIDAVVSRYKNSNAIFAWELANEPRCQGCATSVIYNWAKSTSEYVKSLDPNHLVTLGDEGMGLPGDTTYPYQYGEGTDWVALLNISTLDFGTFHFYPNSWSVGYAAGNKWVTDHAKACVAANKPCFFEEYGTPTNHCELERPWQITSVATPGMAGDAFWQLGDTISTGQTHNDGNTIYYGTDEWTCLVTNHVNAIG
ncbi:Fungal cellulose binding domain-containing protein [Colletotrichum higginsianum IMI 349063]|uniref:Mannan endo-1,4-beta-mannosidase A n=2 Tax=Colletotrichum higginsianum TaxID=80884 RepID=A0A1B7YFG5_COLHI|nr:Fungal cellulose binding domain-containing protein [Colletotrichum higginsianum IMI 349063]OBR10670.1 Fungal cellulose binding domain-containing protein [Colletotrichum higginsianum IMI 349063]TIC91130.1 putative mannan endo-1,4-beta-mannosidase F [Colletotrichum higginsianum]